MPLNSLTDGVHLSSAVASGAGMPVNATDLDFTNMLENIHMSYHLGNTFAVLLTADAQNLCDEFDLPVN